MNIVVLLCAGSGARMNRKTTKQLITVLGRPLFSYSFLAFEKHNEIDGIILVCKKDEIDIFKDMLGSYSKVITIIEGGSYREESVSNAIKELAKRNIEEDSIILIHDSARPLVSSRIISDNISICKKSKGALTAVMSTDSIIYSCSTKTEQLNRDCIYLAQTPQTFYLKDLIKAFESIDSSFTDDAGVMMKYGVVPSLVEGDKRNFKITNSEDLKILEYHLKEECYEK